MTQCGKSTSGCPPSPTRTEVASAARPSAAPAADYVNHDFLRSGSSSEPQNTGQPGEEEQEEMRDTLDPPEDA